MYVIMKKVYAFLLALWILVMFSYLYFRHLRPYLIKKTTKEIEKNPKWLMPKLKANYYGIDDVDVILIENKHFDVPPHLRMQKDGDTKHLQFCIPADLVTTNSVEDIAKLLLISKISIKTAPDVGILYATKSTRWLSKLNYLLDGGEDTELFTTPFKMKK